MSHIDIDTALDDAADTWRLVRPDFDEVPTDPDATSIYDLGASSRSREGRGHTAARRRQIRATRQEVAGLRDALAAGWDVGPELAHQERRLATLEAEPR